MTQCVSGMFTRCLYVKTAHVFILACMNLELAIAFALKTHVFIPNKWDPRMLASCRFQG